MFLGSALPLYTKVNATSTEASQPRASCTVQYKQSAHLPTYDDFLFCEPFYPEKTNVTSAKKVHSKTFVQLHLLSADLPICFLKEE